MRFLRGYAYNFDNCNNPNITCKKDSFEHIYASFYNIPVNLSTNVDESEIAFWAKDAIYKMQDMNILIGTTPNTFSPKNICSVETAFVIIYRTLLNQVIVVAY